MLKTKFFVAPARFWRINYGYGLIATGYDRPKKRPCLAQGESGRTSMIELHLILTPKNRPPRGHLILVGASERDPFGTWRYVAALRVAGRAKPADVTPRTEAGA